jgi:hypothetical protein
VEGGREGGNEEEGLSWTLGATARRRRRSTRRRSVYPQTTNECREVQRMSVGRYTLSRGAAAGLTGPAHERASESERGSERGREGAREDLIGTIYSIPQYQRL